MAKQKQTEKRPEVFHQGKYQEAPEGATPAPFSQGALETEAQHLKAAHPDQSVAIDEAVQEFCEEAAARRDKGETVLAVPPYLAEVSSSKSSKASE